MKTFLTWLVLVILIILQIVSGQSFLFISVVVPFCLVAIVVFSAFLPTEQLLYMALVAGVLLDVASGRDFGLNITFLLFVALFCKLVIRLGERNQGFAMVVLLSALLTVLYNFMLFVLVFSADHYPEIPGFLTSVVIQVGFVAGVAALLYLLVGWIMRTNFKLSLNRKLFAR
jgi:rod shape-determining protein MreD